MRHCKQCGRPLNKEDHEVDGKRPLWTEKWGWKMVTNYGCRVRRLADHTAPDLETGDRKVTSTYVPSDDVKQRTHLNNLRFVPTAILKLQQGG